MLQAQSAPSNLQQAAALIEKGNFAEAEARVREALKTDPDSALAYRLLGTLYEREEKFSEAEEALAKAAQLSEQKDSQVLFELCRTKFALKKTRAALDLASRISEIEAKNPAAHYALGRLLRENSLPDVAAAELERARALEPRNPAVTTELVLADLDRERADEAETLLKSILNGVSFSDLMQAGARFGEAGQYPAAVRAFERAAELEPGSYNARFNLAFTFYHQGEFAKAQTVLERISPSEADSHPDYHYLRGKVELALMRAQVAGEQFLQALKVQPDNESLCMDAGLLFFQHEHFWKALAIYEACSRHLPDSAAIETGLGLTYFRLGKYDAAVQSFRRVLALRSDADAAREALAFLLYVSGNLTEARRLLEERLGAADADYYTYYLHALVVLRLETRGERSVALRSLDQALRRNPTFAPAYFQRGKVRAEEGDSERALADLRRATELNPAYAQPYYLMAQIAYKVGKKEEAEQARVRFRALDRDKEEQDQKRQVENRLLQSLQ